MYKHKVLPKGSELRDALKPHFAGLHESRLKFLVLYTLALIAARTVDSARLAGLFFCDASAASCRKRIERFLSSFSMDYAMFARALAALSGQHGKLRLVLDRTDWACGSKKINALTLAACQDGTAFPLMFKVLGHKGHSGQALRQELLGEFLELFGAERVEWLAADREFIGEQWLAWLREKGVRFYIRVRKDLKVRHCGRMKSAGSLFTDARPTAAGWCRMGRAEVFLSGMQLPDGDKLIIASWEKPEQALSQYKERWQVETMFKALKTRGFNLEDSRVADPERMRKLLTVLAVAFVWAYRVGQWRHVRRPVRACRVKGAVFRRVSVFCYGLEMLRSLVLQGKHQEIKDLAAAVEILSSS